jgi:hypothetical protein
MDNAWHGDDAHLLICDAWQSIKQRLSMQTMYPLQPEVMDGELGKIANQPLPDNEI